ncbi:K2C75 protein, partial [Alaudala cheleensis]|nr:K2C75 protein [Alaudala cheleensis]
GRTGGAGLGCGPGGIQEVTVNQRLLVPLKLETDPNMQQVRQEKDQIKSLSNIFASFINMVRHVLLLQLWHYLMDSGDQKIVQNNLEPTFELYISNTRWQLEALGGMRLHLGSELKAMQDVVEDFRVRFQEEITKCRTAENNFAVFKKVRRHHHQSRDSFGKVNHIHITLGIQQCQAQSTGHRRSHPSKQKHPLQTQISNTSVVLSMDNNQNLDLDSITKVKAQCEDITDQSYTEAGSWYQKK